MIIFNALSNARNAGKLRDGEVGGWIVGWLVDWLYFPT